MTDKGKSYGKIIAWGLALAGAVWAVRKVMAVKSMAGNLSFTPFVGGVPSYKNSELTVPIHVGIKNISGGSLTVAVNKVEVYIDSSLVAYATVPTKNEVIIMPNAYSVLSGFKVALPINALLQKLSDNAYNLVTGNYDALLSRVSVRFDAVIDGALTVSVKHSLAQSVLGLVSKTARRIGPLSDYAAYLPPKTELKREDLYVNTFADYRNTVALMKKVVATTLPDTARLAKWLKRDTVKETVVSVFNFVYRYIRYETDDILAEQVRRPLRTLYDQRGDCDCYSTLIASILTNLGIAYKFRVAELHHRGYYQHVYVIVPVGASGDYYVCDPVLDEPLKECDKTRYQDF